MDTEIKSLNFQRSANATLQLTFSDCVMMLNVYEPFQTERWFKWHKKEEKRTGGVEGGGERRKNDESELINW